MALRGLHLVAVILLGAGLLGATQGGHAALFAVAGTGFAMLFLDLWSQPDHLREVAGFAVVVKLLVIVAMALLPALQLPLFWGVVVGSALFAHAPARFRHARPFDRQR